MPEPNYADILASVEKHFPAHVLEDLEAERKRKSRRARAAEAQEIANNEAPCNTVTPADEQSGQERADACSSDDPVTRCTDDPILEMDGLTAIMYFLSKFLICTDEQRLVLALWIMHSYCYAGAEHSPYLDIRSTQRQSGKSLCLKLLSQLCHKPALTSGFTVGQMADRLNAHHYTLLLDEREALLGSASRSKNPILRGMLASGFERGIGYSGKCYEFDIYSPKAFAGRLPLPESLAERCIPIDLESACPPYRFQTDQALPGAEPLLEWLEDFSEDCREVMAARRAPYGPHLFPEGLTPRQMDCIEPLIQMADFCGESWSQKAREALVVLFRNRQQHDQQEGLQLLTDIRAIIEEAGSPERISTSDLLPSLRALKDRSWNRERPISAQKLATLLHDYGLGPRLQRIGKERTARGYRLQDFQSAWQHFLNAEIANNDAACNTVTPGGEQPIAEGVCPPSAANGAAPGAGKSSGDEDSEAVCCEETETENHKTGENSAPTSGQQLEASSCSSSSQELEASSCSSTIKEIANNDALCNTVAASGEQTSLDNPAFASSQELDASSYSLDDDGLLEYIELQYNLLRDRKWLADTRAMGYEPLRRGDGIPHLYHDGVPMRRVGAK